MGAALKAGIKQNVIKALDEDNFSVFNRPSGNKHRQAHIKTQIQGSEHIVAQITVCKHIQVQIQGREQKLAHIKALTCDWEHIQARFIKWLPRAIKRS